MARDSSLIGESVVNGADEAADQRHRFDNLRERCPVVRDPAQGWLLFRHADILQVVHDHETFSNQVSRHLSVPNGIDPPEHELYRRIVEPYFSSEYMDAFEPRCRAIAARLIRQAVAAGPLEFMDEVAVAFAARAQCASLGWPAQLQGPLVSWTRRNQQATRAGDRERLSRLAQEFRDQVEGLLEERRQAGVGPEADLTARLMHERAHDRPLTTGEIVSILRNWTVGEVGTIAASVGILAHHLAADPDLQELLRGNPQLLPSAIDELLRLDGPLVSNRRRATRPAVIDGQAIEAGEQLSLIWIAANRDPRVFEQPDEFRLDRDSADNLLYGAGIHACPGAPLARLELRVVMEELLEATDAIEPVAEPAPVRAVWPAAGFERLPLRLITR